MKVKQNMLNFTVGPVMSNEKVLRIASNSAPYFRTAEFSEIMLQNEQMMLDNLNAPDGSREKRKAALPGAGGSFGKRFLELSQLHDLDTTEIKVEFGHQIRSEQLEYFKNKGYTALLVNMHETSSGNLYDMNLIASFCKCNGILLIVDAISSFIADEVDMTELNAAVVITGSQKALAVQAGVSIVALNREALERVKSNKEKCMYLSLKEALLNAERGQTPFTPAVTTLLQINERLFEINQDGGILNERKKIIARANEFRKFISEFQFEFVPENMSNAVTCLKTEKVKATDIIALMKDEYNIWLCPNGGEFKEQVFRIGHIGNITDCDMQRLKAAFTDLKKRNIIF